MPSKLTKAFSSLIEEAKRLTNTGFLPPVELFGSGCVLAFTGKYGALSNFYQEAFDVYGVEATSVENVYQAAKCSSLAQRSEVFYASAPNRAKILGRQVKRIEGFDKLRPALMYVIKRIQVKQVKQVRATLIASVPKILIEGNGWHDHYWGACTCIKCSEVTQVNMLGRIYHQIRDEIT